MASDEEYQKKAVALMEEIEKEVGLNDWGDKDSVVSTLVLAIKSIAETQQKVFPGYTDGAIANIKAHLVKRLKIIRDIQKHPEVAKIPIKAPLFIVGSGRTGTTLLQALLGQDPLTRSPLLYEMIMPTNDDESRSPDAWRADRIAAAQRYLDDVAAKYPGFLDLHPMGAMDPEECTQILSSDLFIMEQFLVSIYGKYFVSQAPPRFIALYKYHKLAMQLLEFHNPSTAQHWTFKSPLHTPFIPLIRRIYPDAQFLMMHKHMVGVTPSIIALQKSLTSWMIPDKTLLMGAIAHRAKIYVPQTVNMLLTCGGTLAKMQQDENPPKVVHCQFNDLRTDPVAEIERIYKELGREFTPEFKERIVTKFAAINAARGKPPVHSLEGTGLTTEALEEAYKGYHETYGVKP